MKTADPVFMDIFQEFKRIKTIHHNKRDSQKNSILDINKPPDMAEREGADFDVFAA